MKKQNFYPKQVLRAMAGKDAQTLSEAQQHALKFFMRRSRQYGMPVAAIQASSLRAESLADFETRQLPSWPTPRPESSSSGKLADHGNQHT